MAASKTGKEKGSPADWLRGRADIAEAADRWAKEYVATHELSKQGDIVDALAEAFEACAAEIRKAKGKSRPEV